MPPDTNLFTGVYRRIQQAAATPAQGSFLYTNTARGEGERGSSKGERENSRVIKAELHPPHQAGRQATVHPSRLLLMAWASKNLWLLSHPVRIRVIATMLVTRLKRRRN